MSQVASYRVVTRIGCDIRSASMRILIRAIDEIMSKHHATRTETIQYRGTQKKSLFALRFPEFNAGVGIDIDDEGSIQVAYEAMENKVEFPEAIRNELITIYTRIAAEDALQEMGYSIDANEKTSKNEPNTVILEGVSPTKPSEHFNGKIRFSFLRPQEVKMDYSGFHHGECLDIEKSLINELNKRGVCSNKEWFISKEPLNNELHSGSQMKKRGECTGRMPKSIGRRVKT